jgi:hypothetical protein
MESTRKAEEGEKGVGGQSQLQRRFEGSLV